MTEHYVVSARKYRPDTFRSIVGQEAMASTLRTAVLSGKLSHAYLFCGPRGVGETTAARVLARTINCENLSAEGEACGVCESCRAFEEQRSFNIFELDAASNNSVEDIRQLTEQVQMPPARRYYGRCRGGICVRRRRSALSFFEVCAGSITTSRTKIRIPLQPMECYP